MRALRVLKLYFFFNSCLYVVLAKSGENLPRKRVVIFPYIDSDGVELCHQIDRKSPKKCATDFFNAPTTPIVSREGLSFKCLVPDLSLKECTVSERIRRDLEPFKTGISRQNTIESALSKQYQYRKILVRICNGNVDVYSHESRNPFVARYVKIRAYGIKMLLSDLLKSVSIPDTEFVLSFGDAPSSAKLSRALPSLNVEHSTRKLPVFSVCKNEEFYDILFPFTLIHHGFRPGGICAYLRKIPWKSRISKVHTRFSTESFATFRWLRTGESPRRSPRAEYALLSEKSEKDIDIKFVHIPLKLASEIGLGYSSHGAPFRLPFRSKFKFKYLLSIDGNGYQSNFKNIARGGSLVFKVNTFPNNAKATFEHWYAEVVEGYHLIGLHNSSDLEKMLIWARAHENESKEMAMRLGAKVEQILSKDNILCYIYELLKSYSKLLHYDVCVESSSIFSGKLEKVEFNETFLESVEFRGKSVESKVNFEKDCKTILKNSEFSEREECEISSGLSTRKTS